MWVYYSAGVDGEVLAIRPVPALGVWWMEDVAGLFLGAPVAAAAPGAAAVVMATVGAGPAGKIEAVDADGALLWSARVLSEPSPDFGLAVGYVAWRKFIVQSAAGSAAPPADPFHWRACSGLPVDTVSLGVLAEGIGVGDELDAATAAELSRLRDVAVAMVRTRAPQAPAAACQAAVVRLVGYIHDRPTAADSAWRSSGAGAVLLDWIAW